MQKGLVILTIMCLSQFLLANSSSEAETILKNLYKQFGDTRIELPHIEIVNSEDFVAAYYPGSNKIQIEEKAMQICASFGSDKEAAIAFIIGHELAHAFQDHLHDDENTSFIAYDKVATKCSKHILQKKEHEADIFGAFGAYVAGYKIHRVFPAILNKIYDGYSLTDTKLVNYPPKEVRNQSAEKVKKQVDSLIVLFDAGTKLSLLGEYDLSAQCYENIIDSYKGSEVVNNAGVNYLLEAIHTPEYNIDPFVFPIEINTNTRLQKAKKTGDSKDLNPEEMSKRIELIEKGQALFKQVLAQDQNNPSTVNNYAISLALLENYHEALGFLQTKRLNIDFEDFPSLLLTEALIQNLLGAKASSPMQTLKNLMDSNDDRIKDLAAMNLAIAKGEQDVSTSLNPTICSFETLDFNDLSSMKHYAGKQSNINSSLRFQSLDLKNEAKSNVLFFDNHQAEHFLITDHSSADIGATIGSVYNQNAPIKSCKTTDGVSIIQIMEAKQITYLVSNMAN